ncbi:hypothetical protein TorRG33x02_146020 [Trema orientale]|uniref:Uncharacterized protein n=1 Tax=Trema orientale TaxID=63057 RepID=A0A2P5EVR0_TREOI|nr:hypothetical protein TorRG33x02_146020 [Trema orientale]
MGEHVMGKTGNRGDKWESMRTESCHLFSCFSFNNCLLVTIAIANRNLEKRVLNKVPFHKVDIGIIFQIWWDNETPIQSITIQFSDDNLTTIIPTFKIGSSLPKNPVHDLKMN